MTGSTSPRYTHSDHLVGLVAEVERLASLVRAADAAARRRVAADRADAAIRASLVLDGAPAAALPDLRTAEALLAARAPNDAEDRPPRTATTDRGWLDTLRVLEDPADEEVRALEVVGVARALTVDAPTDAPADAPTGAPADAPADALTDALFVDLAEALRILHGLLTRGLIATERIGAPRASEQAVHDGSVGRMLYATAAPAAVPGEVALLGGWLAAAGSREHALIVSGVVHLELLRIHPFDAANGRLARAAARLLLRARGLDPDGLAAPEPTLARDPLGYHQEVARTLRRRDLTIWLERWGEAVSDGLRAAARDLALLPDAVPERAARFVTDRDDPAFTLADYRAQAPALPERARTELSALLDAGRVRRVPGSRGLRFEVTHD